MRHVRPAVSREMARALFEQRRRIPFRRFIERLAFRRADSAGPAPKWPLHIEQVWLPHYLVDFDVREGGSSGRVVAFVESRSGAFSILNSEDGILEGPIDGDRLPCGMTSEQAIETARRSLAVSSLRQRGRRGRLAVENVRGSTLVYHPYWVCHYERRPGHLDFIAFDAASGERVRAKLKTALLDAFVAAHARQEG